MSTFDLLLIIAGVFHLGLVGVGFSAAKVLNWKQNLHHMEVLSRQLIWVHGTFIVMIIIAFGLGSIFLAPYLSDGTVLSRFVCGFIALFWLVRLGVAFFYFDASAHTKPLVLKLGYHGLTIVFGFFTAVYGTIAVFS